MCMCACDCVRGLDRLRFRPLCLFRRSTAALRCLGFITGAGGHPGALVSVVCVLHGSMSRPRWVPCRSASLHSLTNLTSFDIRMSSRVNDYRNGALVDAISLEMIDVTSQMKRSVVRTETADLHKGKGQPTLVLQPRFRQSRFQRSL